MHSKGCRILRLRSAFTIKNSTCHRIKLLATDKDKLTSRQHHQQYQYQQPRGGVSTGATSPSSNGRNSMGSGGADDDVTYELLPGEEFHIPLALLRQSALSTGKWSPPYFNKPLFSYIRSILILIYHHHHQSRWTISRQFIHLSGRYICHRWVRNSNQSARQIVRSFYLQLGKV